MGPDRPASNERSLALLLLVVAGEYGYNLLGDDQATLRYGFYVGERPAIIALCWLTGRVVRDNIGRFAIWLMMWNQMLNLVGGLAWFGTDVHVRPWAGRAIEVLSPGPFVIVLLGVASALCVYLSGRTRS